MSEKIPAKRNYRDEEFLKAVGKKVRYHRHDRMMTQMELAFECGDADYSQINRIELGKVNFTVSYLALIATALKVSPKDLMP